MAVTKKRFLNVRIAVAIGETAYADLTYALVHIPLTTPEETIARAREDVTLLIDQALHVSTVIAANERIAQEEASDARPS